MVELNFKTEKEIRGQALKTVTIRQKKIKKKKTVGSILCRWRPRQFVTDSYFLFNTSYKYISQLL